MKLKQTTKYKIIFYSILILIVFNSNFLFALDPSKKIHQYVHDNWQREHGLPQNTVRSIIQTQDGYIWMGTIEGFVRFDGVKFKVFDRSTIETMKSNFIWNLTEDSKGNIWIGTRNDLLKYNNNKVERFSTNEGLPFEEVRIVYEDKKGKHWIGTRGGGIYVHDQGKITAFNPKNISINKHVISFLEDKNGNFWIGTFGGLYKISNDGSIKHFNTTSGLSNNAILILFEDKKDNLWIGTWGGGLNCYKDGKFTVFNAENSLISHNSVSAIYEDSDQNLWVGTYGGGLNVFRNGKFSKFDTKQGLSNDLVLSIFEDNERSLWVGTDGGGVDRFRDGSFTAITELDGLSNNIAVSLSETNDNRLLVGTLTGGLNIYDNGEFKVINKDNGLSFNSVYSVIQDSKGNIWAGTFGGGINLLKDNKISYFNESNGLVDDKVQALYEAKDGSIWIGTYGNGISIYKNGKFTNYSLEQGLFHKSVAAFFEDSKGNMWIATYGGGLNIYIDGKIKTITKKQGLSGSDVKAFLEDRDGNIWLGTYGGGLMLFKDNKYTTINSKHGLFDDVVFVILEDSNDNFWMSCNKGIFKVSRTQLLDFAANKINKVESFAYGITDGLKSRECTGGFQPVGWKSNSGKLWFPTIKGVVFVDPDKIKKNSLIPPVYIENLIADKKNISLDSKINIEPSVNKLEFHYTALSYMAPSKVKFKYKLEGFDNDWVDVGTRRIAYYTNLSPGNYKFRVIASNNDGLWNNKGDVLSFYKVPYFYQTSWFYILACLFLILIVFIIYKIRINQIQEKQRQLESYNLKLESLNKALIDQERIRTMFFHNTSHELRTPLNGIIGFSELMKSGHFGPVTSKMSIQLGKVVHLAQSLKLQVNMILDLAKARKGELSLNNSRVDLNQIIDECEILCEGLLIKKSDQDFSVNVSWDRNNPCIFITDYAKLMTILRNLIGNAFKFKSSSRKNGIKVDFSLIKDQFLEIIVKDKGIGIAESQQNRIFEEFNQVAGDSRRSYEGSGLGLAMVKSIIDLMDGKIEVKSKVEFGSSFRVILPISNEVSLFKAEVMNTGVYNIKNNEVYKSNDNIKHEIAIDSSIELPESLQFNQENEQYEILVVDDNELNVEVVTELLHSYGFKTLSAYGGRDALDIINENCPDLVLLDLMMPEVSGEDVLEELKQSEKLKDLPVIILTARASLEDRIFGLSLGADDYIAKPIIKEELLLRTKAVLTRIELAKQVSETTSQLIHQQKMDHLDQMISDHMDKANTKDPSLKQLLNSIKLRVDEVRIDKPKQVYNLVEAALFLVKRKIEEYDIKVEVDVSKYIKTRDGSSYLSQVIVNILNNAIETLIDKTSNKRRIIKIAFLKQGKIGILEIEDSGKGILPKNQSKIFYKNFTTKNQKEGKGLFVSKHLIEKKGGFIKYESRPGKTVFSISFLISEI